MSVSTSVLPSTLYYTRCPAPTATGVATSTGALQSLFGTLGTTLTALQDVDDPELRRRHFDHDLTNLIREGGNIPAIWAKARGADTRLLGITWLDEVQAVVVRPEDDIHAVRDLRRRRIGIPAPGTGTPLVDVSTISAVRGFQQALASVSLDLDAVDRVELSGPRPGGRGESFDREVEALLAGEVDAVWVKGAAGAGILADGAVRPLLRIDELADPSLRVNNGTPRTLTVHRALLEERPDLVEAYLTAIRTATTQAVGDTDALLALLSTETHQSIDAARAAYGAFHADDLLPDLSEHRVRGLQSQADFLYDHGYAATRVDVARWAGLE